MHQLHAPNQPAPTTTSHARTREGGFTMVEIIVVVIIVLVLMSVAMIAFRGSKSAVKAGEAKAVGSAYLQGIAQWQSFSANRNPAAADFLPGARGPRGLDGRPVMTSIPDGVSGGRVALSLNGSSNCAATAGNPSGTITAVTSQTAVVSYCSAGMQAPNFGIRVMTRPGADAAWSTGTVCWLGVGPSGAKRC